MMFTAFLNGIEHRFLRPDTLHSSLSSKVEVVWEPSPGDFRLSSMISPRQVSQFWPSLPPFSPVSRNDRDVGLRVSEQDHCVMFLSRRCIADSRNTFAMNVTRGD